MSLLGLEKRAAKRATCAKEYQGTLSSIAKTSAMEEYFNTNHPTK